MKKQLLNSGWVMRTVGESEWQHSTVPGSVYTDLLRNGKMEDPFWKDNEEKALLLMEKDYEYLTHFDSDRELLESERVILHFYGLDTLTEIRLNGILLGKTDNMHREWEFDVKDILQEKENELHVLFFSPTKFIREAYEKAPTCGSRDAMQGFVHIRKAHCMFGWDWGAHLPDARLFRPVELQGITGARLNDVYVTQNHTGEKVILQFRICPEWVGSKVSEAEYFITVTDPDGVVIKKEKLVNDVEIESPQLWWPNGLGKQPLYRVKIEMAVNGALVDIWERRIGLRTVTIKREKDQWGESFATTVNNVSFFSMGADYIPEDHLLGRVTQDNTRKLLEKAVFANHNCIRVWGGGYYPEDWFYDICDELGLLVWQDFMFACGMYDLTPEFEKNIRAEFADNIKRIRHHASLGLWCGNNEMEMFAKENRWVSKPSEIRDYFFMYERIMPEILKEYDPQTFYWPASPSSGGSFDEPNDPDRGDVHYWDVWHGNKPFTEYRKFFFRYVSEFGFQSFPSEKTVDTFTDDPEDKNIFSYIMEKHQRNGAANGKIMNYMQQMYKYPTDFSTLIYASQLLQADAVRYGVEHLRRNRGRCMGAVYWQLNDCWPVASWSSIDYTGRLKALHYYSRRFFAPVMISCEEEGMMSAGQMLNWKPFEFEKSIRLNVANETKDDVCGIVKWQVRNADAKIEYEQKVFARIPALSSWWMERIRLPEVDIYNQYVSFSFEINGEKVSEGTVLFSYPKYFRFLNPHLTCAVDGNEIVVRADSYARCVEIRNSQENLILSDNYFDMNAGEKRIQILEGTPDDIILRSTYDIR